MKAGLPESIPPAELIRPHLVRCLETVTTCGNYGRSVFAVADLLSDCLPLLLPHYSALLRDFYDLRQAVSVGIPIALSFQIESALRNPSVEDLYPAHVRDFISGLLVRLRRRLDPPVPWSLACDPPLEQVDNTNLTKPPASPTAQDPVPAVAVQALEDAVREWSAHVLISVPPPPPATEEERRVARNRRLSEYAGICRLQGLRGSLSQVARLAGVARRGRGSAAWWRDGRLPDSARTSTRIERVLRFQSPDSEPK